MSDTTLVIMAAGLGSRFGKESVKQLTSFGPSGEIIMDYAIYDAIEAGFNRVIFVIRRDMYEDFKSIIGDRVAKRIEVGYAVQEMEDLPDGHCVPKGRKKPWGTGQAILACRDLIDGPFAVINADDYYGKDAFLKVHNFLTQDLSSADGRYQFCMAGFVLKNTLSEYGGVTRGICRVNDEGRLIEILETKNIIRSNQGVSAYAENSSFVRLDPDSLVSMNFWGFTPDFMDELDRGFKEFLTDLDQKNEQTAEYLLPTIVDRLLKEDRVNLTVLPSADKWFGVTFREDVPFVRRCLQELVDEGKYPASLY